MSGSLARTRDELVFDENGLLKAKPTQPGDPKGARHSASARDLPDADRTATAEVRRAVKIGTKDIFS